MAVLSGRVRLIEVLDQGIELARRSPTAIGVLWLTAVPARLLLVRLLVEVLLLGGQSQHAGGTLRRLAWEATVAWLLSLWGRQYFVRACALSLSGTQPSWRTLVRIPWRQLVAQVQIALVIEALFWALLPLVVISPGCIVLACLGAVTAPVAGPGWWRPIRSLALPTGALSLVLTSLLALCAVVLVSLNLIVAVEALAWLGGALGNASLAPWKPLLTPANPLCLGLLVAGGGLAVEPFYLAIIAVIVERAHARSSGQDLLQWFRDLQQRTRDRESAADAPADPIRSAAS